MPGSSGQSGGNLLPLSGMCAKPARDLERIAQRTKAMSEPSVCTRTADKNTDGRYGPSPLVSGLPGCRDR